jgi:DHA1 family multidrug resistance protein-like MFS transporter
MFTYTLAAFGGPILGPSIGGFLSVSGHWRFIYYLLAIFAGVNFVVVVFLQKETYAPVLHKWKAFKMRKEGLADLYAPMEIQDTGVYDLLRVHVSRPLLMLFTEPPVMYAAAWTAFTYAVIFIFFEAYSVVFQDIYGMNAGEEGLCFFGLGVGIIASTPLIWYFNNVSTRASKEAGGTPAPEARLRQVMLSAPLFVVGL